jgi:hypothetical protein
MPLSYDDKSLQAKALTACVKIFGYSNKQEDNQ